MVKLQCSGDRLKDAGIPPHEPVVVRSEVKVTGSRCVFVCVGAGRESEVFVSVCGFSAMP